MRLVLPIRATRPPLSRSQLRCGTSRLAAVGLASVLVLSPMAQSAAAQQATPTATPKPAATQTAAAAATATAAVIPVGVITNFITSNAPTATPTATPAAPAVSSPATAINPQLNSTPSAVVGQVQTVSGGTLTINPAPTLDTSSSGQLCIQSSQGGCAQPTTIAVQGTAGTLGGCGSGSATTIFQGCYLSPPAGTTGWSGGSLQMKLQNDAVQQILADHGLPASDASRVMGSARDAVRAAIMARLLIAAAKPAAQRAPEEQAGLAAISAKVQAIHIAAATDALNLYYQFLQNPFCFTPPKEALSAGAPPDCTPVPTLFQRSNPPNPPAASQFLAWGNAMELAKVTQPTDAQLGAMGTYEKVELGLVGAVPAATTGATLALNNLPSLLPRAWLKSLFPFKFRARAQLSDLSAGRAAASRAAGYSAKTDAQLASQDASQAADADQATSQGAADAERIASTTDQAVANTEQAVQDATQGTQAATDAAEVMAPGIAGWALVAGPAAALVMCITGVVIASIDLAAALAVPNDLNAALNAATNTPPDVTGADVGLAQIVFEQMTLPDLPSGDPGPASAATDMQFQASPSVIVNKIHYLATDGTYHTFYSPAAGWLVDTDSTGKSLLTLSVDLVDPYGQAWTITRCTDTLCGEVATDSDPSHFVPLNDFGYLDWDEQTQQTMAVHVGIAKSPGSGAPAQVVPRPDLAGERVQVPGEQEIYLVDDDGVVHHVADLATYQRLWSDNTIHPIGVQDLGLMPVGPDLTSYSTLIRYTNVPTPDRIYLMLVQGDTDQGSLARRWITNPAALAKFGFDPSKVEQFDGTSTQPFEGANALPDGPEIN